MSALEIPCPHCGTLLRLPDESYLGRKAKCGKCRQPFILELPDAPIPESERTLVGEFVKWVPEDGEEAEAPTPFQPITPPRPRSQPAAATMPAPALPQPAPFPDLGIPAVSPVQSIVRRKKANWTNRLAMLGIFALLVGGGGYYVWSLANTPVKTRVQKPVRPKAQSVAARKKKSDSAEAPESIAPIDLTMMPAGVEMVFHLRPAEIWGNEQQDEFRASLGALEAFLASIIRTQALEDPAKIEELVIGLIPGIPGSPPDVAVVVHTVNDNKRSDLISKFGEQEEIGGRTLYVSETRAHLIKDARTYAICPKGMAQQMVDNIDVGPVPRDELNDLLPHTNRNRPFTLAVITRVVWDNLEGLWPQEQLPQFSPMTRQILEWVGDDVSSVAWSLEFGEEEFNSRITLLTQRSRSKTKVRQTFEGKMDSTPREFLKLVRMTHPRTKGQHELVGRLPAMMKSYCMLTYIEDSGRAVSLDTTLPLVAAPNLAAAGAYTWLLSNQADFGQSGAARPEPSSETKLPELIADRLKKRIDADFRDYMLQDCIRTVGEDTGVEFKLLGDDLKQAGVTQNVKQKMKLDQVPATQVLDNMLTKYGLVLVVDEEKKIAYVTSEKAAKDRKMPIFPLK